MELMEDVLSRYFERPDDVILKPITQGLINSTYEVFLGQNSYILQKLNTTIFQKPEVLISNTILVGNHLKRKNYEKGIIEIIPNLSGNYLTFINGETWRLTNYILGSVCYDQVVSVNQAYAAAVAISEFHSNVHDISINTIEPSIAGFLDYQKRVTDYKKALEFGNQTRAEEVKNEINYINDNLHLIERYLAIDFPSRIVHADAKISNFLFSKQDENIVTALIDWDTFLPGNILCDFGDMVRTYASLKPEDDPSEGDIFSLMYYQAVKDGFLSQLKDILSEEEIKAIDLTAYVVILIQAIRFVTDFLNNDIYYHTSREKHNMDRTINQINLLKQMQKELCIN